MSGKLAIKKLQTVIPKSVGINFPVSLPKLSSLISSSILFFLSLILQIFLFFAGKFFFSTYKRVVSVLLIPPIVLGLPTPIFSNSLIKVASLNNALGF